MNTSLNLFGAPVSKSFGIEAALLAVCEREISASVDAAVTVSTRSAEEFSADEVTGSFRAQGVEQVEYVAKAYEADAAADDWSMV